jgi:two-component system sensor histidine kinase KdpD
LITNLLDMTRLESGGLLLKKEWQPVQEIIGSALHHMDQRLQGRPIKTHIPSDLPMIEADSTALDQVISNLLDNAVEYTPLGSPIDITASARNGEVAIEVADRGPGLPAGTEDRVFQKFFRIEHPASKRGLGLGLAICQGIVGAHGGKITASNRPGGGAVFRIALPNTGKPPHVDSST